MPRNGEGDTNLPEEMVESNFELENEMQDIAINYCFGDINDRVNDTQYMINNVILYPLNKSSKETKNKII